MTKNPVQNNEYLAWLAGIKNRIRNSQIKAALSVSKELLSLYWSLGEAITEKQYESQWGDAVIEQLAHDLSSEFPDMKGFSRTNLFNIRKWYLFYSRAIEKVQQAVGFLETGDSAPSTKSVQQPVGQLPGILATIPWGHHVQLITKCADVDEALFYIRQTTANNWSRNILSLQIEGKLYKRQGKNLNNFPATMPEPQSDLAIEIIKNPYVFDFLAMEEKMQERELEKALTENIKKFLLELGRGFAYVGNQVNIAVAGDDYFLDLLFYNYHMHCFVVFELKVGDFKPEYTGKLNFYINAIDGQLKGDKDNQTIGILLCKTPNETVVKYSLKSIRAPMGVSEFELVKALPKELKNNMPTVKELEAEMDKEYEELQKPVDKKLQQVKEKLAALKQPSLKEKRNPETCLRVLIQVVIPLRNKIKMELDKKGIPNDFAEMKIVLMADGHGYPTDAEIKDAMMQQKEVDHFEIDIWLYGLKAAGAKAFDIYGELGIITHHYGYIITPNRQHTANSYLEKMYDQLPDKNEIQVVTDKFIEALLDQLEQNLNRLTSK